MKILMKIVGGIVVCLILLLVVLRITGLNPRDRTPGLWLSGNLVTTPVTDWSFTDKVPNIKLQTESWYGLPHSVTINCLSVNCQFYVSSVFPAGTPRSWNDNVMRNPHVRIKIGNDLYDRTMVPVTDPVEREAALQARAKKYPTLKVKPNDTIHIFRVVG
jgi:hypothetical protein